MKQANIIKEALISQIMKGMKNNQFHPHGKCASVSIKKAQLV